MKRTSPATNALKCCLHQNTPPRTGTHHTRLRIATFVDVKIFPDPFIHAPHLKRRKQWNALRILLRHIAALEPSIFHLIFLGSNDYITFVSNPTRYYAVVLEYIVKNVFMRYRAAPYYPTLASSSLMHVYMTACGALYGNDGGESGLFGFFFLFFYNILLMWCV